MRKILIFISCILTLNSIGQNIQTKYLKSNGKETKKLEKAEYVQEISQNNGLYHLKQYSIETKNPIFESELASLEPYIENGITTYYDKNSDKILAKGSYSNGELIGEWIYLKNSKYDTVKYEPITNTSLNPKDKTYVIVEEMPLFAYSPELVQKRKALDQKLQKILSENKGNVNNEKYLAIQKQIIELNGIAFDQYKADKLCYPLRAKEEGIKGIVYVAFVINENGKIVEAKILKGVDKDLETETIRLITSMNCWKSGKQKGKTVRVEMTAGVKFE